MGDPKRRRKKYEGPRHPWQLDQLEAELRLVGEYGLRNKRELWRLKTMLSKIRGIARALLGMAEEERRERQAEYLGMLVKLGLLREGATIDDVLDLDVKDLLERRLQTIVYRRGLAKTIHQARQMVAHGHILVGERRVTVPGYLVKRDEESSISYAPGSPFNEPEHPALASQRA
ncbi:MAG: 30S ribosomal protein S4 [Candidatus Bathyarchaeia archaeon]|nr:30S ribosomal protein S4 [Candidatus Bathyarchaeota archaeon]